MKSSPFVIMPVLALFLAGCGAASPGADDGRLQLLASFYPLQYVTEHVGGDRVSVSSLTPPGAEPHDLELTPQDVAAVSEADLVVVLGGFQPAVDEAVEQQAADTHLDVAEAASLNLAATADEHGDEDGHADEDADAHADETAGDPHFWLDPLRLADVADAVADRLSEVDPEGEQAFRAGADDLRTELVALDDEISSGLAQCESTDLVVSHEAFGYLAQRYGLDQVGIAGLSPDSEPQPGALAEVTDQVQERGVTTIFTETLVSPALAETVAAETGATTAVLDPLEGLTDESAGDDYVEVMRANLEALRTGLTCT